MISSGPYGTFLNIHFEVGGDTISLEYQKTFWPTVTELIAMADRLKAHLTLQFNPQWVEYIARDTTNVGLVKRWQAHGHEVGLHHHGYDHGDWNGYTNRPGKEDDPRFRGSVPDMMKLMRLLVHPHELLSGTITDEKFDYPEGIKYDTEGIQIYHARSIPKRINLNGRVVIQVGMALMSYDGDIESFKREYRESKGDEIFGVVTHEQDFAKNPEIIEEWLKCVKSKGKTIKTVNEIITKYKKTHPVGHSDEPLTFLKDVKGAVIP